MAYDKILQNVQSYYSGKLLTHGATPRGVDLNSPEAQKVRFDQLLRACDPSERFSIIDYGCGYGALADYMIEKAYRFRYFGFDISEQMISKARELHRDMDFCEFTTDGSSLKTADYTVASGVLNVKLDVKEEEWKEYVLHTLGRFSDLSKKAFAFNLLTSYSDRDRMRPDLHYADPCYLFDYCMRTFSRNVALLHDYRLYDFTIIVRK